MIVKTKPKPLLIFLIIFATFIILIGGMWAYLVSPVNRNDDEEVRVVIKSGTNTSEIGTILKEKKIIKSKMLFKLYVKLNHVSSLKASTYRFKRSMSLNEVIELLEKGHLNNKDAIKLVFKPGERMTDYAMVISKNTDYSYDEVIQKINDKTYLSKLIGEYWFLTDSILDENIYYPLEGYLAADTYYIDSPDTDIEEIIKKALDEMEDKLEKYKTVMSNDPHYYVTMASIVQLEGTNTENRKKIVGVFLNRMASGYNLGSDVTTYYALQKDMKNDLKSSDFTTVNPYNTRAGNMIGKMPIGPICGLSDSSIEASVYPEKNDYLFFVADKHGNIYFSKTNAEHDKKIAEIKAKGDWIF